MSLPTPSPLPAPVPPPRRRTGFQTTSPAGSPTSPGSPAKLPAKPRERRSSWQEAVAPGTAAAATATAPSKGKSSRMRAAAEAGLPNIEIAKQHLHSLLERDPRTGDLLPLDCPLKAFEEIGTGIAAYMSLVLQWRDLFWMCFLLELANIVTNVFGRALPEASIFTVTSIANAPTLTPAYGAMEAVVGFVLCRSVGSILRDLRAQAKQIDADELTAADFCLEISGLPPDAASPGFKERIGSAISMLLNASARHAVAVESVAVSIGSREATTLSAARQAALERIEELEAALLEVDKHPSRTDLPSLPAPDSKKDLTAPPPASAPADADDTDAADGADDPPPATDGKSAAELRRARLLVEITATKAAAARAAESLNALADSSPPAVHGCSGTAFVRLGRADDALAVLGEVSEGGVLLLPPARGDGALLPLTVTRAPEPEDIIWENVPCTSLECGVRQLLVSGLMLALSSIGTVLVVLAQYTIPQMAANASSTLAALAIQLGSTACILAGNLPIFILGPLLELHVCRHKTTSQAEASTVLKLVFFQVLNTVAASTAFSNGGELGRDWYAQGASLVMTVLIGDIFIISLGVDVLQPGIIIGRYLAAPQALTQREMNVAYAVPPDFYLVFRLQLVCKFVTLCCIYSPALPLLFLVVACLLAIAPVVDRYNLLRRFPKTKDTDNSLPTTVLLYVLPPALLAHLGMAYALFASLISDDGVSRAWDLWASADADDYESDAFRTVDGEAWALRFVLLSLCLNGTYLLVLLLREWPSALFGISLADKCHEKFVAHAEKHARDSLVGRAASYAHAMMSARIAKDARVVERSEEEIARISAALPKYVAPTLYAPRAVAATAPLGSDGMPRYGARDMV